MDKELKEYRNRIGTKEYRKEYHKLYSEVKQHKERYSKLEYENSKEKINQIKEKYKNGVTPEILAEFIKNI